MIFKRLGILLIILIFCLQIYILLQDSEEVILYHDDPIPPLEPGTRKAFLAIGVLSQLSKIFRRNAIRMTWFNICKQRQEEVSCRFFTDSFDDLDTAAKAVYNEENRTHHDLLYMPYKGGHNFALNLIWMLEWYLKRFNFDYFLRVDDDYFICLDRLLTELPYRPIEGLYWGWIHCEKDVVRVDEGWMILSRDIIEESISNLNTTLLCHPFGDQAVALWLSQSKINIVYFSDNQRVDHHSLITKNRDRTFTQGKLCEKYLAIHRTYPDTMLEYWVSTQDYHRNKDIQYNISNINPLSRICKFKKKFDWKGFLPGARFEPKLCKDNPSWSVTNITFKGREGMSYRSVSKSYVKVASLFRILFNIILLNVL